MRSNESYDNSDEKIIRKAYSDCGPILQNNVLNNETHDLKLDLNSLKTLERGFSDGAHITTATDKKKPQKKPRFLENRGFVFLIRAI